MECGSTVNQQLVTLPGEGFSSSVVVEGVTSIKILNCSSTLVHLFGWQPLSYVQDEDGQVKGLFLLDAEN